MTLFVNWAVKPFSMALLGWIFIGWLFKPYLPADQISSYIAGLILLAAAPCTAMVFVWSNLSDGEPHFTLSQVALNDVIMVFAFAPIVGLLLGISAITVPWETLLLSVGLYIVVPVILAQAIRRTVISGGGSAALSRFLSTLQPVSLLALLATLVLLFGFQGQQILAQPLIIAMLAVPILIQVYFNSGLAYLLNRAAGEAHCVAAPSALIGASNFFELAVAAAISLFGFNSGAALATVVGVLIEVPVMLSVVKIVNGTRGWYEAGATMRRRPEPTGRAARRMDVCSNNSSHRGPVVERQVFLKRSRSSDLNTFRHTLFRHAGASRLAAPLALARPQIFGCPAQQSFIRKSTTVQGIPPRFLEQIFTKLRTGNYILSQRGNHGGYILAKQPSDISIGEIIRFIDGSESPIQCLNNPSGCKCRIS